MVGRPDLGAPNLMTRLITHALLGLRLVWRTRRRLGVGGWTQNPGTDTFDDVTALLVRAVKEAAESQVIILLVRVAGRA